MKESDKARDYLNKIEKAINNGKPLRRYTSLDLLRFAKFKEVKPGVPGSLLISLYDHKYPEKTHEEKLDNFMKFLNSDD